MRAEVGGWSQLMTTLLQLALGHGLAGLLLDPRLLLLLGPHCLLHGHRSPAPVRSLLLSTQRRLPAAAAKLSIVMVRFWLRTSEAAANNVNTINNIPIMCDLL